MKRFIASALAVMLAASACYGAEINDKNIYSTDMSVILQAVSQLDSKEKESFINENLDITLQHMSALVTLVSNSMYANIPEEVKASLDDGLSPIQIKEAIYHSAAYCGYTRAEKALAQADKALEELGQDITYESRITSTESSRYTDGLEVQRFLFGPQIGTVTEDMSEAMKLQTVYLSGICFGDFYNRTGLSLYTREFLTFCTIVGNGNCAGQLNGHLNGNLNVGHSADMLRAAVLLNEKYNGSEKTALALSVINSSNGKAATEVMPEPEPRQTIQQNYKSDSEELSAIKEHFRADDKNGFIDENLSKEAQALIEETAQAVIDGKALPTSEDKSLQLLIDISAMTAQGGRESEIPEKYKENIESGNTPDMMLAVPLLCVPYNGFPRTLNMMSAINSAAAEVNTEAEESVDNVIQLKIGESCINVNGENIAAEPSVMVNGVTYADADVLSEALGTDKTGSEVIDGKNMLPVRKTAEKLGLTVLWNTDTRTAAVMKAERINETFEKGPVNPVSPKFTGVSYLNNLTSYDENLGIPSFGLVTFEPCTRTDWHSHDGGQILLVTEGKGIFKAEGEEARYMLPGDVILIPPGKKHIHCGADNSWFQHIALGVNPGVGTTNWYEKVSDSQYEEIAEEAKSDTRTAEARDTMFPKGDIYTAEGYNGTVYRDLLVANDNVYNCPEVYSYTFEKGAYTQQTSSGQVIAVTNGSGIYEENGKAAITLNAGDTITIQPGISYKLTGESDVFAFISSSKGDTANNDSTVVTTKAGKIKGNAVNGVYSYLGVPYAEAKEMFVKAQPVTPWEGVFDATKYGNTSPQGAIAGGTAADDGVGTSNNCQNLNIWTPGTDNKKRAVMVWLHGGGFSSGSANEEQFNGANLSKKEDVVVVGVNHRLNVMGHLDLSAYGKKYKNSENIGIVDIVDALKWVNENIESFGGDPDNVTIFGESGGGAKVLALMTTPYAKGLFGKGIVESGATEGMGVYFTDKEISADLGALTLEKLGLTPQNVDEIQKMSIPDIQKASDEAKAEIAEKYKVPVSIGEGYAYEWEPVIDGDFLPTDPVTENGFAEAGKDIPLLIGSNLNEWSMFVPTEQHTDMTAEEKAEYQKAYPNEAPETAMYVDTLIRKPMLKIMSHKADQNGAKVYSYLFTKQIGDQGSYHTAEIPYVFANIGNDKLSDTMSEAWANFAKTGVPSAKDLPEWEPYNRENMAAMILDDESYLAHNHDKKLIEMLEPDYEY